MDVTTHRLRACGIAAGPFFLTVWVAQAFTRDGFDPGRHPLSLLALGSAGWIQIANFVVTGGLVIAAAAGLRDQGRWLPRFVGALGIGLILAGVFVTDPGAGFPAGAPEGRGDLSWHGLLHEVGFGVVQLAWIAAAITVAKRAAGLSRWPTIATIVLALVVAGWPDPDSLSVRLVAATAIQFAFLAVVCAQPLAVIGVTRAAPGDA
ncbi:uncharacterized protein DUF998 [Kribbella steppae]|uniref:Uncharacterized protein DUF998 n=1 Tax=Kribbella steppae TaxID=2512223 RepID=A0A4R2HP26_9ACTN|nr:DUF998 domain-containing protein [Kribbella steppae]TCO30351.1 uncharacterized protein DUF998 [Kribbella steppae]